jgi:metal-responsive CopG/Arc/MetJ family transcriptional regulator
VKRKPKTLIAVRLEPELLEKVARVSERISLNRSETIRVLIQVGLKASK